MPGEEYVSGDPEEKKTILLVENEALIALDESEMLEASGFRVIVAESGEDAVAVVRSDPSVDLVLMDVDLGGGMDGTDTARVILAERDIPVVFLSSHTEKELVERTDAITSYGYVVKNSGDVVLLASIRMAFRLHEAHAKLKESEERYRTLVEHSPAAILIHQNGIVRYGNQAAAKLFGAASWEEFVGKNALEAVHPDDRNKVIDRVLRMMETGEPAPMEVERFVTADGRVIHVQVAGARINWEGQAASQTIGIDVTEQILAQRELQAQSERREGFFNSLPVIVWYMDRDGRVLWGNDFAARTMGLTSEECLGRTVFDLFPEAQAARFHADNMEVITTGSPKLDIIEEYRGAEGGSRWAHTSKYPLRGKDDVIEGVVILAIDITGRVRAETALRDSERRQRSFLNAASDMAFIKDEKLRYLMVNQAYVDFLGRPEHEILGATDDELMIPEAAAGCRRSDEQALTEDRLVISLEVVGGRTYETRKFPVMLGGRRGVGGFVRDITEARRDDDALRESELKYRRLFDLESDAIFLIDNRTGDLLEANEAACRLYGYTREEFTSLHNYDLSAEPEETRRATGGGLTVIPVRYHRKKSGEIFPVEITATHFEWQGRAVHIAAIRDISFRIEAEKQLRESELKYRQIFNHAPAGIYEIDVLTGRFISVNQLMCEYTGYSETELLSMNAMDILAEESRAEFLDRVAKIHRGENVPAPPEFCIKNRDGSTRWVQLNAEYTWRDERIVSATVVAYDIGERKKAEEALKASEEKYRQLFTFAPAGIYEVDFITGRFVRVNSLISEYTGYTEEELLTMGTLNILTEESQLHFLERLEKINRGESVPMNPEFCMRNRDGSTRWVQLNVGFIRKEGRVTGATVVAHDISERKKSEDALRESEERYALIANNVADTITIMDLDLNVHYASPSIERLRGFTVDEVMTQTIDQILTPESIEIAASVLKDELDRENDPAADRGRSRSLELQEYHKNGSVIWVGNSFSFLRDENGRPHRILIVSRDITERKRAEKALEEALVENRTLLHELRHRVKNSIAMIASMVALEAGRVSSGEAREALDDMRNRILSLSHMYDMIHSTGESTTVRLDSYLQRIVRSLSETLAYDRERIEIRARCENLVIETQRAALFGLIVNELVTNAVKHAFPGGGSGTVSIELAAADCGISLSVADNGVGLGESFDIERSEGLGMKLVRLLARQMKAELSVERSGGTRFSILVARA